MTGVVTAGMSVCRLIPQLRRENLRFFSDIVGAYRPAFALHPINGIFVGFWLLLFPLNPGLFLAVVGVTFGLPEPTSYPRLS